MAGTLTISLKMIIKLLKWKCVISLEGYYYRCSEVLLASVFQRWCEDASLFLNGN